MITSKSGTIFTIMASSLLWPIAGTMGFILEGPTTTLLRKDGRIRSTVLRQLRQIASISTRQAETASMGTITKPDFIHRRMRRSSVTLFYDSRCQTNENQFTQSRHFPSSCFSSTSSRASRHCRTFRPGFRYKSSAKSSMSDNQERLDSKQDVPAKVDNDGVTVNSMSTRRGTSDVRNDQFALPNINVKSLEETLDILRDILGYPNYDVSLTLEEDEVVTAINSSTRGIESSTDILSFPVYAPVGHETFLGEDDVDNVDELPQQNPSIVKPGVLPKPPFEVEDYYNLGDMIISVPYVMRAIEQDRKENEDPNRKVEEAEDDEEDDEYEWVVDDRGISGAMSTEYDTETRLHMLLVHGMLHLVGFDHETDDDYELMVTKEDEILALLKERKGGKLV